MGTSAAGDARALMARVAAKPCEIVDRKRREGAKKELAGFHLRRGRGAIRYNPPDDTIQIGKVVAPIIRVAFGDDELAAFILHKAERPRAHGRGIRGVLANIASFIDMLGRNIPKIRQRTQQKIERHGAAVAEHRRMGIRRINCFQEKLQG